MEGWIKLHRCLLHNPIVMKDADHLAVWTYLLLSATHQEYPALFKGEKILLKPGQVITGRKSIASKLDISESKVYRVLNDFKNEHQIEQQPSNKNSLITILNWDIYQNSEQQNEHSVNNNRTSTEHQLNTNKNVKNDKNVRRNNKLSCDDSHRVVEEFGFNAIVQSSVDKWIDYKYERKDSYTPTGLNTLLGQIQKKVDIEGTDFVTDAIDNSISNTWKGIIWDSVKNNKRTVQSNEQVTGNQFVAYMMRGENI